MYMSDKTFFQAKEPPLIDKFYFKDANKTLCIMHADKDWNMRGEVRDPFNIPLNMLEPKFSDLTQYQCEELLVHRMPPPTRKDVLNRLQLDRMWYDQLMYRTRLIRFTDNYWLAWSEHDKIEDYHPRWNKEILKEHDKYILHLDPEPDDIETPLLCQNSRIEDSMNYRPMSNDIKKLLSNPNLEFK